MTTVQLPRDGRTEPYVLGTHDPVPVVRSGPIECRLAYAAAHVSADAHGRPDWEATLAFRHHLWSLGLGVADAMDTAQRGSGLSSPEVRDLILRSSRDVPDGARLVCGVTTDELQGDDHTLEEITAAYVEQLGFVEAAGSEAVMMASRALARSARSPHDYAEVYSDVLGQSSRPVILHWLGPMFDPRLEGYWGSSDPLEAMESLLDVIEENREKIVGVKISMLDKDLEIAFRSRLPQSVRCFTGDDFNYPALIKGDESGHSDALLGIFDAIAPVAAAALQALDMGDIAAYDRLLQPTVALSRRIFEEPTFHYKTGLVFLAYLNGHQDHFRMLGGHEDARTVEHLADLVRLADVAGLFADPERVAHRLRPVLEGAGV
jgi:hypothetical protein